MNQTRQDRIAMVEANIEESRSRMEAGKISAQQFARLQRDGRDCIAEIKTQPDSDFKTPK